MKKFFLLSLPALIFAFSPAFLPAQSLDLEFSTYLGGTQDEYGNGIAVDSASCVYVSGKTNSANFPTANPYDPDMTGTWDAFIFKLDSTGSAVVFSTYVGGLDQDIGEEVAVDGGLNIYLTGFTDSADFPTLNPYQSSYADLGDAFLTKLESSGSALVYSTYLGGDGNDWGLGLALNSDGEAYVSGDTSSQNFPTKNPCQSSLNGVSSDAFIARFASAGSTLVFSTYLGGADDADYSNDIALDSLNCVYVTGDTYSADFPTLNAYQATMAEYTGFDAFVSKLSSTGSALIYSTYLGGSGESGQEKGESVAVDENLSAYVAGSTTSDDFPTVNPYQASRASTDTSDDVFLTKFSSGGSTLVYSTYLGGDSYDRGKSIAVDTANRASVCGETVSSDYPKVNQYQSWQGSYDAFLTTLDSAGSSLFYSTYLGGASSSDRAYALALGPTAGVYLTGYVASTNFPTVNPYQPSFEGGTFDAFIAKFVFTTPTPTPTPPTWSVSGKVFYNGWLWNTHTAYVGFFTSSEPEGEPSLLWMGPASKAELVAGKDWSISNVTDGEHYAFSFWDADDSGDPGGCDPEGEYASNPVVVSGSDVTDVNITIYDICGSPTPSATPSTTPSPAPTKTPPPTPPPPSPTATGPQPTPPTWSVSGKLYYGGWLWGTHTAGIGFFTTTEPEGAPVGMWMGSASKAELIAGKGYSVSGLEDGDYFVYAFWDADDSGTQEPDNCDPEGLYPGNPVVVSGSDVSGANPVLYDRCPPFISSGDYDGDGTSDIAVFRGDNGLWAVRGVTRAYYGDGEDLPVPGDYDGDGTTDIGIFRPGSGLWGIRSVTRVYYGAFSDLPVPGDYNGDGRCDVGIFRTSSGLWAVTGVTRAYYGTAGDFPVPGDYDGDNAAEIGLFRGSSGLWAIRGLPRVYFGGASDWAVPGDYNGDGNWEPGIFRPSSGLWAVIGLGRTYFGSSGDHPVPADFNGDGLDDAAVFRPSSSLWGVRNITRAYFGAADDIPVTR